MKYLFLIFCFISCATTAKISQTSSAPITPKVADSIKTTTAYEGFFNFEWNEKTGKILLTVKTLDTEFLYVNSLAAGVGSNDIGLDRGQLGQDRVVKFVKSGPKILLVQLNTDYRAVSDNMDEITSVEQAFAQSVLGGFKVIKETEKGYQIDLTPFLLRDAHDVIGRLQRSKQGNYKLDANRSAIYLPRCKTFPDNAEFEATLTFAGTPKGEYIRSV
ncbi:MAG: DUF5117 domain-containing protein, partial [Bacteroidia bacterium]|nr:DUF5117 domain-containing protein [Bacteroidia bacterium]